MALGNHTAVISFFAFLILQFTLGIILDNFLNRETNSLEQWWWSLADTVLLLFWLILLFFRRSKLLTQDMHFLPVPTMAIAWGLFFLAVFVPRVTWLMEAQGVCIGQESTTDGNLTVLNDLVIGSVEFSGILSSLQNVTKWETNALSGSLSIGSALMLVALAAAGYGQHGLFSTETPLDFNMASAVANVMDGVDFLSVFWDSDVTELCTPRPLNCAERRNGTLAEFFCALEGPVGELHIALAVICFAFPVIALWQFKRRSGFLKAGDVIKDTARRLTSVSSSLTSSIELGRRLSSNSDSVLPEEAGSSLSLSPHHADFLSHQRNLKTKRIFEKELVYLDIVYDLADFLLVNSFAFILRIYLWVQFDRPLSVLISKNILSILLRTLGVFQTYINPWYQKRWGKGRDSPDGGGDSEEQGQDGSFTPVLSLNKVVKLRRAFKTSALASNGKTVPVIAEDPEEDLRSENSDVFAPKDLDEDLRSKKSEKYAPEDLEEGRKESTADGDVFANPAARDA